MYSESVAKFLRAERERRGLTARDVAKELGMSPNTLSTIERTGFGHTQTFFTIMRYYWDSFESFSEDYLYWQTEQEDK